MEEKSPFGLTEGDKRYLSAIIQLSKERTYIRALHVAAFLGVSKPSVSVALRRLNDKGYISIDSDNSIHLLKDVDEAILSSQEEIAIESPLTMQLSVSEKKYIWAIEQLQKEFGFVRSIDVADKLDVSKASVSIALKKLREKGIVLFQPNGSLSIVTADLGRISTGSVNSSTVIEATEQARREAEEKAQREAAEQARREAEEIAQREAAEQARREAEEIAQHEAAEQVRREAEEKARFEAEKGTKQEAEAKVRQNAEDARRRAAEAQRIAEKARINAEILELTNKMNSLKGLFARMRRKKLQARIDKLNEQLRRL